MSNFFALGASVLALQSALLLIRHPVLMLVAIPSVDVVQLHRLRTVVALTPLMLVVVLVAVVAVVAAAAIA